MNEIFHSRSAKALDSLITSPPQTLMILGPTGSGKFFTSEFYARSLLSSHELKPSQQDFQILTIMPNEKGTISIDDIRDLYEKTRSKTDYPRIVIIDQAQSLTTEAQNAVLKLLEEPPKNAHFVLTVDNLNHVLPTIRSRAQKLQLYKPPIELSSKLLQARFPDLSPELIQQNLLKADGWIGRAVEFLTSNADSSPIETARQLLASQPDERFIMAQSIMTDREAVTSVLEGLLTICALALKSSAGRGDKVSSRAWIKRSEAIQTSLDRISQRANHKLQFLNTLFYL